MLVNEANRVQDMLLERLRENNLEDVFGPEKSQCLDMDDTIVATQAKSCANHCPVKISFPEYGFICSVSEQL